MFKMLSVRHCERTLILFPYLQAVAQFPHFLLQTIDALQQMMNCGSMCECRIYSSMISNDNFTTFSFSYFRFGFKFSNAKGKYYFHIT